jgi:hypothetical protein
MLEPTPYPDVNAVLREFEAGIRAILGEHFRAMYLSGSLAQGEFDAQSSDIDFVVVTDAALDEGLLAGLKEMHARFDTSGSPWAGKIEAVYVPQEALRHYPPPEADYPQVEKDRPFFLDRLEPGWIYQCYILREHGIALAGPEARTLIDPVDPDEMRRAAAPIAETWLAQARNDPSWLEWLRLRGAQAFVVLTLCRLLYTLDTGAVASKPGAARWASETLGPRWADLIAGALAGQHAGGEATDSEMAETIALVQYTVERFREWAAG